MTAVAVLVALGAVVGAVLIDQEWASILAGTVLATIGVVGVGLSYPQHRTPPR